MIGHVIISHGLNSGPDATKATALAQACDLLGWRCEIPDYRDLDAAMPPMGDVRARIARLQARVDAAEGPVVLAGSSMGAFISCRVALARPVQGLFLMAPPIALDGFDDLPLDAPAVPLSIVHGWHDELIPAGHVVAWAEKRAARLSLVNDSHRLADHVDYCAQQLALLLGALS